MHPITDTPDCGCRMHTKPRTRLVFILPLRSGIMAGTRSASGLLPQSRWAARSRPGGASARRTAPPCAAPAAARAEQSRRQLHIPPPRLHGGQAPCATPHAGGGGGGAAHDCVLPAMHTASLTLPSIPNRNRPLPGLVSRMTAMHAAPSRLSTGQHASTGAPAVLTRTTPSGSPLRLSGSTYTVSMPCRLPNTTSVKYLPRKHPTGRARRISQMTHNQCGRKPMGQGHDIIPLRRSFAAMSETGLRLVAKKHAALMR